MTDPQPQEPHQPPLQGADLPPVPYELGHVMPQPLVKKANKLPWIIGGSAVGLVVLIGVTVGVTIAATSDSGSPQASATTKQPSAWDLEQQATNEDPTLDEGELGLEATSEPMPGPTLDASKIKLAVPGVVQIAALL
jgi:hypothetical protein